MFNNVIGRQLAKSRGSFFLYIRDRIPVRWVVENLPFSYPSFREFMNRYFNVS